MGFLNLNGLMVNLLILLSNQKQDGIVFAGMRKLVKVLVFTPGLVSISYDGRMHSVLIEWHRLCEEFEKYI